MKCAPHSLQKVLLKFGCNVADFVYSFSTPPVLLLPAFQYRPRASALLFLRFTGEAADAGLPHAAAFATASTQCLNKCKGFDPPLPSLPHPFPPRLHRDAPSRTPCAAVVAALCYIQCVYSGFTFHAPRCRNEPHSPPPPPPQAACAKPLQSFM